MNRMWIGMALLAALYSNAAPAQEVSANLGFNSHYIYRGIPQEKSSVFGGVDLEHGGFYLGTWAADVGDGAEIDYYGGYNFEAGAFDFSIGGTWYTYTGGFDDEYLELNLGVAWKWLSLDMASGKYDNFGGPEMNYQFYSLTASHNGFYGKFGTFEDDFDGSYFEAGYGGTLSVDEKALFDYGLSFIHGDSTILGGKSDTHFALSVSRSFDF